MTRANGNLDSLEQLITHISLLQLTQSPQRLPMCSPSSQIQSTLRSHPWPELPTPNVLFSSALTLVKGKFPERIEMGFCIKLIIC